MGEGKPGAPTIGTEASATVGASEVVSRIFTLFSFLSARMPAQGRDVAYGGDLTSFAPSGNLNDFAFLTQYKSEALGRDVDYGVLLPPDYYLPEKTCRAIMCRAMMWARWCHAM